MKWLLSLILLVVYLLHQDFWNWEDKSIVLGFLPIGLAYHAGYAVLASITMALLVRYAWPHHLEEAEHAGAESNSEARP